MKRQSMNRTPRFQVSDTPQYVPKPSTPKKSKAQREFEKERWRVLAEARPSLLFHYVKIVQNAAPFYIQRTCAKCQGPNMVLPRVSQRYFGKAEIRLCKKCQEANIKASSKRTAYKRKLRGSTEIKNTSTHTTSKRAAYQDTLDALLHCYAEWEKE
jgi:hypothetical protein